jgi:hypothetical protein
VRRQGGEGGERGGKSPARLRAAPGGEEDLAAAIEVRLLPRRLRGQAIEAGQGLVEAPCLHFQIDGGQLQADQGAEAGDAFI